MNPDQILALIVDLYSNIQQANAKINQLAAQNAELQKANEDLRKELELANTTAAP